MQLPHVDHLRLSSFGRQRRIALTQVVVAGLVLACLVGIILRTTNAGEVWSTVAGLLIASVITATGMAAHVAKFRQEARSRRIALREQGRSRQ